jgi:hypothetical protein
LLIGLLLVCRLGHAAVPMDAWPTRLVGYSTNDSCRASVLLRISLAPWEDHQRLQTSAMQLVANISIFLNAGTLGNASSDPYEAHVLYAAAELHASDSFVTFPSVFDPASDLEQFLLKFKPLLGNTSCMYGRLGPDGSMTLTLGDAFSAMMMTVDKGLPSPLPLLWRSTSSGRDSVIVTVSIRGSSNAAAQILLATNRSRQDNRRWNITTLYASASSAASSLGCATLPVVLDSSRQELRVGNAPSDSCLSAAWRLSVDPAAVMRMLFLSPSRIVVFPQRADLATAVELGAVTSPTVLVEGAAYCGNYANTPFLRLEVEKVLPGPVDSAGTVLQLGFEISSLGFTERVMGVLFTADPATGLMILVNRSEAASLMFLSVIGTVGRSPWIEMERESDVDGFWVTISIGGFSLTRCRV